MLKYLCEILLFIAQGHRKRLFLRKTLMTLQVRNSAKSPSKVVMQEAKYNMP